MVKVKVMKLMKCEKCNAEFTIKEQAKAKGGCPSCGEKLPVDAYRDDAKAWRWYQFHTPMPLSMILAYLDLVGGCMLAVLIVLAADLRLWSVTSLVGWLFVIARHVESSCERNNPLCLHHDIGGIRVGGGGFVWRMSCCVRSGGA